MDKRSDRIKHMDAGDGSIRKKKRKTEGWCDTGHLEHWCGARGGDKQSGMEKSSVSSLWRPERMSERERRKLLQNRIEFA